MHDERDGTLRLEERKAVLAEINKLLQLSPNALPENRHYLLEIDFAALESDTEERRSYWLLAMKAVVAAGRRTASNAQRAVARQRHASAPVRMS